jgi:cytochrome b
MLYVWSWFVRISHWLLTASFAVAFTTHSNIWDEDIHITAGYAAGILSTGRILWGIWSKGYSNFATFPFQPREALRYLVLTLTGRHHKRYIGHNPAGSIVIYAMLTVGLLTVASGILHFYEAYLDWGEWSGKMHSVLAWTWLALAAMHVSGVLLESVLLRENLIGAMITGFKPRHPHTATSQPSEDQDAPH